MSQSPSAERARASDRTPLPTDGVDHRAFWQVLERFAGTLVDRYELDEVLARLGDDIARVLSVPGAGVMLADEEGNLRFTSTSGGALGELERLQIEYDEGPCLLAYRSAEVVLAGDLRRDERFPRFSPHAVDEGLLAVYSFPMHVDEHVIGALNLYNGQPGPLTDDQVEVGGVFADVATAYLMNARDIEQKDLLTKQLQQALNHRLVIEQAKGYVASGLSVTLPDAFGVIRDYARRHQIRVRMVARALVHGDLRVEELVRH